MSSFHGNHSRAAAVWPASQAVKRRWQLTARPGTRHYSIARITISAVFGDKNEIRDEKAGGFFACSRSCHGFAVLCRSESTQRVGGSELCAADRLGVQWLPLRASGTQPRRTKVQAARLRR